MFAYQYIYTYIVNHGYSQLLQSEKFNGLPLVLIEYSTLGKDCYEIEEDKPSVFTNGN